MLIRRAGSVLLGLGMQVKMPARVASWAVLPTGASVKERSVTLAHVQLELATFTAVQAGSDAILTRLSATMSPLPLNPSHQLGLPTFRLLLPTLPRPIPVPLVKRVGSAQQAPGRQLTA